jgi:hypothetical protein
VKKDIRNPTTRAHWTLVYVIGQKPPELESQGGRELASIALGYGNLVAVEIPEAIGVVNRCRYYQGI